jgi:glycosyltransferase involved in cell wall biosynthesis
LVVQNLAGRGRWLRQALSPRTRLLFWSGHGVEQPAVQPLRDPAERAAYDGFVLVSAWQRERYRAAFELDLAKTIVLGNGISPAFANLFGPDEAIVAAKARPPVLAYTSTPDRGLDLLLEAFPRIREAVPGATLELYSGLRLYGVSAADDEARHGALYQQCRATAGVELIGPVSQPELARRLRRTAVLAYPNTVPETYCIAAREAMAAGCVVVSSARGALPETTAGFARLVAPAAERSTYLDGFVAETVAVLKSLAEQKDRLRRQVTHVVGESTWDRWADRWAAYLLSPGPRDA